MTRLLRNQRGAASLEILIVLVPWVIVIFIFFNLLFLLSSLMINQAAVNRAAQQIAAVSCVPPGLERLVQESSIGVTNPEFVAVAASPVIGNRADVNWDRGRYIAPNGKIDPGSSGILPLCNSLQPPLRLPSGNYIYVQLQYEQNLPLLAVMSALGISDTLDIERGALVTSPSLEIE